MALSEKGRWSRTIEQPPAPKPVALPVVSAPPTRRKGRPKVYHQERRVLGVNLPIDDIAEAQEMLRALGISFSSYIATLLSEDLKARRVGRIGGR